MDLFDLYAKISLDTSEYERGLNEAGGKTSGFADKLKAGLGTAAKVGAAAVGAATAAVTAFAKSSVDVGMSFDSSMSQVAATMGTTVDQIGNLRDFAMEMGANTAFSATQAADALNYMALAGYDVDEAMTALPNVLNLAAAGNMDLALASDMVTDAQSALGLSMEESAQLVDKMAMASSKSNTSVGQLGDAILTVGGTAKNLAGGTTELSAALGILADNGIKGAEGGTALRNIILSLSAPTDKAASQMKALGLEVYDAQGNMRPLNDVFNDLNGVLSTMTQGEQTQVLNTIFNKVDLKSANALLANAGERFDELSGYIDKAQGAAEKMANTQLDNLAGDITLFKSAMEGAQIVLSDQLTPNLREFVRFGTNAIGTLSTAFKEGGLTGAMEALGTILSEGLNMVIEQLPNMIDAGMQLLGALGQGLMDNLPVITDAAVQIILMLVEGIISALPGLFDAALQIIIALGEGLADALPELAKKAPEIIISLVEALVSNLPKIVEVGLQIVAGLAMGLVQAIPELLMAIPRLVKSLIDGFCELLGIHSPSTVFAELGGNIVAGLLEGVSRAWETVVAFFSGAVEALLAFLSAAWDSIHQTAAVAWEAITGVFSAVWSGVQAAWSGAITFFSAVWAGIQSAFAEAAAFFGGVFSAAWEAVKAVWDTAVGFFTEVGGGIRAVFTEVCAALAQFFSAAWDAIRAVWEAAGAFFVTLGEGIRDLFAAVSEAIVGFFQQASEAVQAAWEGVVVFFSGVWDGIKSVFSGAAAFLGDVFFQAWQAITSAWDRVQDFFTDAWEAIKDVFSDVWSSFKSIGGNIVDGIKTGVSNAWNKFLGWLSGRISGLVEFVMEKLGIHSPSRVFAGIGENMALGLGEGWGRELEHVKKQIGADLDFGTATVDISATDRGRRGVGAVGAAAGDVYNFYSPKALDPIAAAREMKKARQQLAMGFV